MPEAAVNQDHGSILGQDDVGFSRQILRMEPVPEPTRVQRAPELDLRFRVPAADARHHSGAGRGIYDINHADWTLRLGHAWYGVSMGMSEE